MKKKIKLFGMAVLAGLVLVGNVTTSHAETTSKPAVKFTKLAKEKSEDNAKLIDDLNAKELKPQKDGSYFVQFESIDGFSVDDDMADMLERVNKYIEAKGLKRNEYDLELTHAKYAVMAVLIVHRDTDNAKTDKKSDKKTDKKDDKKADKKSDKKSDKKEDKEDVKDSSSDKKEDEPKEKTDETALSDKA